MTAKANRKRPAVSLTLSPRVLELVDKRAKEAGLSRSRIIEAAVLATWEEAVPDGHKGGLVQCRCGAAAFIDGGPELDLEAEWECSRCMYARLGLRVPAYDDVTHMLNTPEITPLLASVRGWSSDVDRRFITLTPAEGRKLDLMKLLMRSVDWRGRGFCPPRVGLAQGLLELVWTA